MENVIDVAAKINTISKCLTAEREKLKELTSANALAQTEYDKGIGVAEAKHHGAGMPVTLIKAQAKKDSADLRYMALMSDGMLKATYVNINTLQSQMVAQQSIFKRLDAT